MNLRLLSATVAWACICLPIAAQVPILWYSPQNAVNQTSDGQPMDEHFTFELGVFEGSFVPTPENLHLWVTNWTAASSTPYFTINNSYSATHSVDDNDPPFSTDKPAYVWGKRELNGQREWILFRAAHWNWPYVPDFPSGPALSGWIADEATAVIGQINSSGIPFLMKSAAVPITWEEWKTAHLTGEPLNGPHDDPDRDGTPNLLEFAFGTTPTVANAPVATPVVLDENGHPVITIPRRIDHLANYLVEVSGNLVDWNSGLAHTEILQNDAAALRVRDLTPVSSVNPKRFIRLKVTLP